MESAEFSDEELGVDPQNKGRGQGGGPKCGTRGWGFCLNLEIIVRFQNKQKKLNLTKTIVMASALCEAFQPSLDNFLSCLDEGQTSHIMSKQTLRARRSVLFRFLALLHTRPVFLPLISHGCAEFCYSVPT